MLRPILLAIFFLIKAIQAFPNGADRNKSYVLICKRHFAFGWLFCLFFSITSNKCTNRYGPGTAGWSFEKSKASHFIYLGEAEQREESPPPQLGRHQIFSSFCILMLLLLATLASPGSTTGCPRCPCSLPGVYSVVRTEGRRDGMAALQLGAVNKGKASGWTNLRFRCENPKCKQNLIKQTSVPPIPMAGSYNAAEPSQKVGARDLFLLWLWLGTWVENRFPSTRNAPRTGFAFFVTDLSSHQGLLGRNVSLYTKLGWAWHGTTVL